MNINDLPTPQASGPDAAGRLQGPLRWTMQHPVLHQAPIDALSAQLKSAPLTHSNAVAAWETGTDHPYRPSSSELQQLAHELGVDLCCRPVGQGWSQFRVLACDMDSTLITIECVDEIAQQAGRGAEVAAMTEAAMRGEDSDYDESLRRRVALLRGVPLQALETVWNTRLALTPGAETLLAAARRHGLATLLVSGGFTWFTERLQDRLNLDATRANVLGVDTDGCLDGTIRGTIVNARVKRETLEAFCRERGCTTARAIAVGDGANDLDMMAVAGLSVAYRAKPLVQNRARVAINHTGLDGLLAVLAA